ncbi:ABC transporter permease [Staphylococcus massiliensis]|nr:nickel ABC transporter permease [Staphylococcus massiliensis]MCG3402331.1 ABC transporter permease [Staphylococcus massiliensis]MCG3411701.1 ABC transporter permease [Staphylococcus massiliensis]
MIKKIAFKLFQTCLVLFVLSLITFILMKLAPGDPLGKLLHLDSANLSQSQVDAVAEKLHLNDAILSQWWTWFVGILHLDFGDSIQTKEPVLNEILLHLPLTLILCVSTIVLVLIISIPLGILAGVYQDSKLDQVIRFVTSFIVSIPSFFLGIVLIYVFSKRLHVLPPSGFTSIFSLVLPVIALSLGMCAYYVRLMRSTIIEHLKSKEVQSARLRGLSEAYILRHELLKPSLIPIVSMLGMSIGGLVGATVVIENLFGLSGIGSLMMESIKSRDYPVVQGVVLMLGGMVVVSNMIADIIVIILDPGQQYRLKSSAKRMEATYVN